MAIRTQIWEKYGKRKMVAVYDKEKNVFLCYKVYDEEGHVIFTTIDHNEAHLVLLGKKPQNQRVKKDEKINWIFGLSGSEWDDVVVCSFKGTKQEAKKMLEKLIKDDKKEDSFDYAYDIKELPDGRLYTGSTFRSCHTDYTATPVSSMSGIREYLEVSA